MDNFLRRKQDTLSRKDKSSKGDWDEKILKLCDKINLNENYYTTSSCSGRIVLMINQDKKAERLFLKIWHDLISFEELKKELGKILHSQVRDIDGSSQALSGLSQKNLINERKKFNLDDKLNPQNFITNSKKFATKGASNNNIKFKQESVIIHVACKTFEDAKKFLLKSQRAGFKRSGIISSGKRFVVECISTEKLEFPIINNGKLIVDNEFLKIVVGKANENLEKGWGKIERLGKSL